MTSNSKIIYEIICNSCDHLCAEDIFFKIKEKSPGTSMATVYNNLNSLVGEGLIKRIEIPGKADRFDKSVVRHEHLICEKCGKVTDIKIDGIEEMLKKIPETEISSYSLVIRHICADCRDKI